MSQLLFPDPPLTPGQTYDAPNGITYTWDPTIGSGVWTAAPTEALTITNPGTITGTAEVGATLNYAQGTATGGSGAISYSWQWFITPSTPLGAVDAPNVTVPPGALGKNIYVTLTATDSATPIANVATANTSNYPTPPATIQSPGITNAVAPTTIPGTANFIWANGSQNLTATGCIEFSVNGGTTFTQASTAVGNGTNIITQWIDNPGSGLCGDAPDATSITGTLSDGTRTTTFNFSIDRVPSAFSMTPNTETTTPLTVTAANPTFTLTGANTAPLIWGTLTGGGTSAQFSVDGGTNWFALPSVPTSGTYVPVSTPTKVRFTTSGANGTDTLNVFAGASTATGKFQSSLFTVTVATAPFPNSVFSPASAPNASPASVNANPLFGTATCSNWQDGATSLTSTGGIQFQVNGGGFVTSYPGPTVNGDIIDVIWDPSLIATTADNTTLNGTLTNGTFTNTYNITVARGPVSGLNGFVDLTNQPLSTPVTSAIVTPGGFNVPVSLTFAGTTADPLNPVDIDSGSGFNPSPQTVNPGSTLQIQGTTGPNTSTYYGVDITMGSGPAVNYTWQAETIPVPPSVTTPSIQSPGNNSTGISTTVNVTGSSYIPNGTAGTHASSDWEVYKGSYPLISTNQITNVTNNDNIGTWNAVTSWSAASSINTIVFANNLWVSGDSLGNIASSTDGTNWTVRASNIGGGNTVRQIEYGNGRWVACVQSKIWGSADGINWSEVYSGVGDYMSVAYGNGKWFAIRADAQGIWSSDGVNWNTTSAAVPTSGNFVRFGNGQFFIAGYQGVTGPAAVYKKSDPSTGGAWGSTGSITTISFPSVLYYGNGKWICGGGGGSYVVSTDDGGSWTPYSSPGPGFLQSWGGLTYANGVFYAVGGVNLSGYHAMYSSDGTNWTSVPLGTFSINGFSVAGGNGYFVAVGSNVSATSTIMTSGTSTVTLAIAGCQTDGFLVGDSVISDPGAAAGPATITSLDNTQVVVTASTGWANGQYLKRDPASYVQIVPPPANPNSTNLTTLPLTGLSAASPFYARVRYTSNPTTVTSDWSAWSKFTTA